MQIAFEHHGQHAGGRLFLLIHGMEHTARNLAQLKDAIVEAFPQDDILLVTYPAGRWSNLDPIQLVKECVARIQSEFDSRGADGYDEIILVGHSLGALFARKVCLLAHGICSDYSGSMLIKPAPQAWANKITRLVLLAGMSRGWRLWPRNRHTPLVRLAARCAQYGVARVLGRGSLARAAHRGSPFIVNFRLDWLSLSNGDSPGQTPPQVVVQLAGMHDTVVHPTDHIDLQAGKNFKYYEVEGTSHDAMIRFSDSQHGPERKRKFMYALQTAAAHFEGGLILQTEPPDETITDIVLTMHGIRDYGKWQEDLTNQLIVEARARNLKIATSISNYDFQPLIPFLFGWGRSAHTEGLMDRYAEVRSQYPKAKCSFAGHSNGTYLMAHALRRYHACSFERVAFMGSIVQRNFPWLGHFKHRVSELQNHVASADEVVAIFPSLFEMVGLLPFMSDFPPNRDFGSAGHTGFTQVNDRFCNVAYVSGGHGAGLQPQHRKSLVSFLLGDAREDRIPMQVIGQQTAIVVFAHKACVFIWIFLLAVVAASFVVAARHNIWLVAIPIVVWGFILFLW